MKNCYEEPSYGLKLSWSKTCHLRVGQRRIVLDRASMPHNRIRRIGAQTGHHNQSHKQETAYHHVMTKTRDEKKLFLFLFPFFYTTISSLSTT